MPKRNLYDSYSPLLQKQRVSQKQIDSKSSTKMEIVYGIFVIIYVIIIIFPIIAFKNPANFTTTCSE